MRNVAMTALAMMVAVAPAFAVTEWNVDKAASNLKWEATFNGQAVHGEFKQWDAAIAFDPANLGESSLKVTVPVASVDSGDGDRDGTLKGADFFNAAVNPEAVFESSFIQKQPDGSYIADGTLTLAGVKQGASLAFTVVITGDKAEAHGKVALSRGAYGVGKGQWAGSKEIGDEVNVMFTVNATKK